MNAAIPERAVDAAPAWVLYDGDCAFCREGARRFQTVLEHHGFKLAPLQTPWVRARFGLDADAPPAEMMVLLPDGRAWGGADGVVQIARRVWWTWPLYLISRLPGMMILFRAIYRWVAARRYCGNGACAMRKEARWSDWLPLAVLASAAWAVGDFLPGWIWMWLLAWTIFYGFKWLTWRRAMRQVAGVSAGRSLGYLFADVGMEAKQFLRPEKFAARIRLRDWLEPAVKLSAGVVLVWVVVRELVEMHPLLAGWVGMVGLILCLHFGLFELLALAWQYAGVETRPLMRRPLRATSLADFWGCRWNTAFHRLANDLVFRRWLTRGGLMGAVILVFVLSGLVHELLITMPARGGYGLPTAYFLIQGAGLLFERTDLARRMGLGRGGRGWLFTACVTVGPVYWLFPPVFVHNIILPMLHAIGAT